MRLIRLTLARSRDRPCLTPDEECLQWTAGKKRWTVSATDQRTPKNDSMNTGDADRCERLRVRFEGRQAIYVEKGALRVKVTNIRWRLDRQVVSAMAEEIPTPGLGVGLFREWQPGSRELFRWKIGAGFLTSFSEHGWAMGYGGWTLYFHPTIIKSALDLALRFSAESHPWDRYNELVQYLFAPDVYRHEQSERVFQNPTDSSRKMRYLGG